MKVLGFTYKGDEVIIKKNSLVLMNFKPDGIEDENKVCSFNEEVRLSNRNQDLILNILITSNGTYVLDTLINIAKENKEPFISIEYPHRHNLFKRTLFVADATDSSYIKY